MGDEAKGGSWLEHGSALVGIVGSIVTIALTVSNQHTKTAIDERQAKLEEQGKALDAEIRRRSANVEESKERVERYKWVYSLVPSLSDGDAAKRNAALAMMRLALTKDEAEGLLAGLQQSPTPAVREAATQGLQTIARIETETVARLVQQMNAESTEERRQATGRLQRDFADSADATALVLASMSKERIAALTPNGLINGLFYLSRTEPRAWTAENLAAADAVLPLVRAQTLGARTKAELDRVEATVARQRRP